MGKKLSVAVQEAMERKYPGRSCLLCKRYPCYEGQDSSRCDCAKYGCFDYKPGDGPCPPGGEEGRSR